MDFTKFTIRYRMVSLLVMLTTVSSLLAQDDSVHCDLTLSGRIIDAHDTSSLEYATIYIKELNRSTYSDKNGQYSFKALCRGRYTVQIAHLNCETITAVIDLKESKIVNFTPEHHAEELKDVEVFTKRLPNESVVTEEVLGEEKLNQTKGQSLGDALKQITGVNSLNNGYSISKPIIHGLHSNRILILNNGIRQEGQQWGSEHAPEVDPFIAGTMRVIKGANSVRYGSDAIAGVILIEPRPVRDSAGIGLEFNTIGNSNGRGLTNSAIVESRLKKNPALYWRLQGTYRQNGTVHAPTYNLVNSGLKEQNFSYLLGWKKKKIGTEIFYSQFNTTVGILSAAHIGNLTDLQRAFVSDTPMVTGPFTYAIDRPYQFVTHELFKFQLHLYTGSIGKLTMVYGRQYNLRHEFDKHRPRNDSLAALNLPELEFELTTHTADLVWEHYRIKNFHGQFGMNALTQGNTYEGRALIPNFKSNGLGVFWIERWKYRQLEVEGGIRYDYKFLKIYKYVNTTGNTWVLESPERQFKNATGSLGLIYHKDSTWRISLNTGSAWRAPNVNELYSDGLHHGAAAIEYGNSLLKTERTYNVQMSLKYKPSKQVLMEVSPYVHYIDNFIYRLPTPQPVLTIRGAFPAFNYTQTNARIAGVDANCLIKWGANIESIGKISILRARNLTDNNWLIWMPSDKYELELLYRIQSIRHRYYGYLSASGTYVTKQWRVPAQVDFALPPAGYFLLNLHASTTFKIKKQSLEIGLNILNALNNRYRDYMDRFRYFADAMGRNVTLRLTYKFNQVDNKK